MTTPLQCPKCGKTVTTASELPEHYACYDGDTGDGTLLNCSAHDIDQREAKLVIALIDYLPTGSELTISFPSANGKTENAGRIFLDAMIKALFGE